MRLKIRRASAGAKRWYSAAECADRLSRTTDLLGVGVVLVDEIAHAFGEVDAGSLQTDELIKDHVLESLGGALRV
jgi:hypothetical protein